jgi:hypothetical protein
MNAGSFFITDVETNEEGRVSEGLEGECDQDGLTWQRTLLIEQHIQDCENRVLNFHDHIE